MLTEKKNAVKRGKDDHFSPGTEYPKDGRSLRRT